MMHCKKIDKDPALTAVYNKMYTDACPFHPLNTTTTTTNVIKEPITETRSDEQPKLN
jgi:hypothetical protein